MTNATDATWWPNLHQWARFVTNTWILTKEDHFLLPTFIQELSDLNAHQRRETMIKGIAPSPINNPIRKFKTKLQIVLSGYKIRNPIHSPNQIQTYHHTIRQFCDTVNERFWEATLLQLQGDSLRAEDT